MAAELRILGRSAAILISRDAGGVLRTTAGVDLTSVAPAPSKEGVDVQLDAHGVDALMREVCLRNPHALDEIPVGGCKRVAVREDGLCLEPL